MQVLYKEDLVNFEQKHAVGDQCYTSLNRPSHLSFPKSSDCHNCVGEGSRGLSGAFEAIQDQALQACQATWQTQG